MIAQSQASSTGVPYQVEDDLAIGSRAKHGCWLAFLATLRLDLLTKLLVVVDFA